MRVISLTTILSIQPPHSHILRKEGESLLPPFPLFPLFNPYYPLPPSKLPFKTTSTDLKVSVTKFSFSLLDSGFTPGSPE